jgi:hypothetical protein
LAWTAAVIGAVIWAVIGWKAFDDPLRADGNWGHATVDFGGQWLMGRLLVTGQGRNLYERSHQRAALREAYSVEDEKPKQEKSDADAIMDALMGTDQPAESGEEDTAPRSVGGPLYPPINAFVYAPWGALPPRMAYRLAQMASIVFLVVAAGGVSLLARGRIWWPVAAVLLMVFPCVNGSIRLAQNAPLSLTFLVWGWLLVARGRLGWAGVIWGLLAYKPVWAVAFFLVPVLTRRWRMAGAMLACGTTLALLTLPFVGWHSWIDWLHVGREAAQLYDVDANWIEMSRDVLSIPRRVLFDFSRPSQERAEALAPTLIGWAALLVILETTVRLACFRWRRPIPFAGPSAAFVQLGAWLTCYHFMYYDVLLAALPVLLLFTEPRRYLEPIYVGGQPNGKVSLFAPSSKVWIWNRMAPTMLVLLIATQFLWFAGDLWKFSSENLLLAMLWMWCGWTWLYENESAAG